MGVWKYNLSFWLKKTVWLVQWTSKQESSPILISAFGTWTSKIKGYLYLLIFKGFIAGCLGQVLPTSNGSVCHFVKQYVQVTMETTILILKRTSVRKICFWTINVRKKCENYNREHELCFWHLSVHGVITYKKVSS